MGVSYVPYLITGIQHRPATDDSITCGEGFTVCVDGGGCGGGDGRGKGEYVYFEGQIKESKMKSLVSSQ